ncbi:MAG: LPXTG cell wall anchor domain-containing protein, partial [Limosilactobacillus sp.]|nr:LPXTG cell wall anchor domain-containing protein [Limosilactobacillus sp.]
TGDKPSVVVVTYPDGSKDEVPVTVHVTDDASNITPNVPTKTGVTDKTNLTDDEKDTVKDKIVDANDFPTGTTVEVGDDGTTTITYPDGSQDTIPGDQLVFEKPSVDESGKTPVNPTDDAQDTGVIVNNPSKDTDVTAHDEDGKTVATHLDDNHHVIVTPGTKVDGPITATITDPNLDGGQVDVDVDVNGHTKDHDDNGGKLTDTDNATPNESAKTGVNDTTNVTVSENAGRGSVKVKVPNHQTGAKTGQLPQTGNDQATGLAALGLAAATATLMLGFKRKRN